MKFTFLWVGRTHNSNLKALQDEYLRRLSHFTKCRIFEAKDASGSGQREIEGKRILELLNPKTFACLLDVGGRMMSSTQLAETVESWQGRGLKEIAFIIGGSDGVSDAVRHRADIVISLSFMTFTHEMARVILVEQLYRVQTIIKGFPYQK